MVTFRDVDEVESMTSFRDVDDEFCDGGISPCVDDVIHTLMTMSLMLMTSLVMSMTSFEIWMALLNVVGLVGDGISSDFGDVFLNVDDAMP